MNLNFLPSVGLGVFVMLAASACGTGAQSFCDQVCACTGCSESERAECVDSYEDSQKTAEEAGCEGEFDALVECSQDELECKDGAVSVDGCDAEFDAAAECADAPISIGGNVCESVTARFQSRATECGLPTEDPEPGEEVQCTEQLAAQFKCFDGCLDDATCEELNGEDLEGGFYDCLSNCAE